MLLVLASMLPANAMRRLYIDNQTGWTDIHVYLHNDPQSLWPMGSWPGQTAKESVVVHDITYDVFEVPDVADNRTVWIVYHDNKGNKINDTRLDLLADLYLRATPTAIFAVDPEHPAASSVFERLMEEKGGIVNDFSDSKKISVDEPSIAYVNISGFQNMPQQKTDEYHGWIEYFDDNGNYFKKRIIAGAQGSSSLMFPKKNIKFDLCEDEWIGDATTDVAFGDWVKQDGFHLKAYYVDYLRGVGAVGYKIFDDVTSDRGDLRFPWQRAGVEGADKKALCHPEGFPAAVYLNGNFYGVYAWQLKKHRKNMGMEKDNPAHIHLDGTIFFFYDNLDWTQFEVRNPKKLYCQDGKKYDGDNPRELMGEDSPAYDPENPDHVNTAKVKKSILALTRYCPELRKLKADGASSATMREEFEKRFDLQGWIDYTVFSSAINNTDGWYKNWQYITYDGEKWFVEPYDLDLTFGHVVSGGFWLPPQYNAYNWPSYQRYMINTGPAEILNEYYAGDLDARYAQLRDAGVITPERIKAHLQEWYDRVGEDYYRQEYEVWNQSGCVRGMEVEPDWKFAGDWEDYGNVEDYNNRRNYKAGAKCRAELMVFEAVRDTKGHYPLRHAGYHDSLQRFFDWVDGRIALQDYFWHYTDKFPVAVEETVADKESSGRIVAVYNLSGIPVPELQPGLNIVRYADGHSATIFIRR